MYLFLMYYYIRVYLNFKNVSKKGLHLNTYIYMCVDTILSEHTYTCV